MFEEFHLLLQVFCDVYIEDPYFMCEIAHTRLTQQEQETVRRNQQDKAFGMCTTIAQVIDVRRTIIVLFQHISVLLVVLLQMVMIRHQLLDVAYESELLSKVRQSRLVIFRYDVTSCSRDFVIVLQMYMKLARDMGYDECHLFMRSIQFEFAKFNDEAGKPPPVFITAIQEDDTGVDR